MVLQRVVREYNPSESHHYNSLICIDVESNQLIWYIMAFMIRILLFCAYYTLLEHIILLQSSKMSRFTEKEIFQNYLWHLTCVGVYSHGTPLSNIHLDGSESFFEDHCYEMEAKIVDLTVNFDDGNISTQSVALFPISVSKGNVKIQKKKTGKKSLKSQWREGSTKSDGTERIHRSKGKGHQESTLSGGRL